MEEFESIAADARRFQDSLEAKFVELKLTEFGQELVKEYSAFFDANIVGSYRHVPTLASDLERRIASVAGEAGVELFHMAVLADLLRTCSARLQHLQIPDSVLQCLAAVLRRILLQLPRADKGFYLHRNDLFAKDFAVCRLRMLPFGSELADLHSGVPRRIVVSGGARQACRALGFFAYSGGFGNWYESHWDRRLMRSFTPQGYDDSYLRLAELLERNPHIRGVASASWWFDPALEALTPKLSFLRTVPQENGAQLFLVGVDDSATNDATSRSPERQRAFLAKQYEPKVYSLAWNRKDLIAWSKRYVAHR